MADSISSTISGANNHSVDKTDNISCAWIRSVVKLQRQILHETMAGCSHENCESILRRQVDTCGVFRCCHGIIFLPSNTFQTEDQLQSAGAGGTVASKLNGNSSSEQIILSKLRDSEDYFQFLVQPLMRGSSCTDAVDENSTTGANEDMAVLENEETDTQNPDSYRTAARSNEMNATGSTQVNETDSFFHCPICLDAVPVDLAFSLGPFRHTVCVGCTKLLLLEWNRAGADDLQCPVCREEFPLRQQAERFSTYLPSFMKMLKDSGIVQ